MAAPGPGRWYSNHFRRKKFAPAELRVIKVLIVPIGAERARRELLAIPLAWCAVSGATLWAIEAPGAWVMAIAAGVALLFRLPDRKRA